MFIEQAYKGNNAWWRVVVTIIITTGILISSLAMYFILTPEELQAQYDMMKQLPSIVALALNLLPFVFLLAFIFICVYLIHKRSILSLTTSRSKWDIGRVFFGFAIMFLISIAGFAISYFNDSSEIVWNFDAISFSILVVVSFLLFPIQVAYEEYLFRGYLMQQIGIIAKNRWFPLIITSVLFGLFHSANPEVMEMGFGVMAFYIGTGLFLGIVTLMDESLELAIGLHLGNNIIAALLMTSEFSALQTDAIFKFTGSGNTGMLYEMIVTMAITYPIILLILAKRYKWSDWQQKLFGRTLPKQSFLSTTYDTSKLQ